MPQGKRRPHGTAPKAPNPLSGGVTMAQEADGTIGPSALFLSTKRMISRRLRYEEQFNQLAQLILDNDVSEHSLGSDFFPILQVGFIARAMGLNLCNAQVVLLVELVEEDSMSYGYVRKSRLCAAIVDALMTGVVGGPTLAMSGAVSVKKLPSHPSPCLRDDEKRIFEAFRVIDRRGNGFLQEDELRYALMNSGETFTEEEMEVMLMAAKDPETGLIQYRDFADILATE